MTRSTTERRHPVGDGRNTPTGCRRSIAARGTAYFSRHSSLVIRHFLGGALVLLFAQIVFAAEVLPPAPDRYFNDYAHVVSPQVGDGLNAQLEAFEKSTSNQIVVAIFPKMQTGSSIEDYSQRIFESWKPGQKKLDNGAILFVFVQDHKMRIHTGYGLEGALPDITCKRIIDDEIAPRFKAGDFNGGLTAGVNAMIAATRGEYKGTGRTVAQNQHQPTAGIPLVFVIVVILVMVSIARRSGTYYNRSGRSNWGGGPFIGGGWSSGGGSSWSSGSSGGGGFSGGGGSSGGGGASGSW